MPALARKYLEALGIKDIGQMLNVYNPWWKERKFSLRLPSFHRDVFSKAKKSIAASHELALLINGPRRVGKTTLMNQLVRSLIEESRVLPRHILFFSMDDPVVQQIPAKDQGLFFEAMFDAWTKVAGTALRTSQVQLFCFLDEIQRLPRWELYLKRYIDLKYPIRFVISGSASHTIFRKSLESLLGRVIETTLPPFTFREWVRFHHEEHAEFLRDLAATTIDVADPSSIRSFLRSMRKDVLKDGEQIRTWNEYADVYAQQGGFPQLWDGGTVSERASFVDLQFVQRVTLEDLRLVKEIRRPEIFHQFLRYAFARTGDEYNLEELARLIQTTRVTLAEALPLLLQTELIRKVERFTEKPVRLRSTHAKLYAADPILTQAMTKISTSLIGDAGGRIAETLVHNTLRQFPGLSDITYYREPKGEAEIDFVVRIGDRIIPIETNYQTKPDSGHRSGLSSFIADHGKHADYGILVTKSDLKESLPVLEIPLPAFLLMA